MGEREKGRGGGLGVSDKRPETGEAWECGRVSRECERARARAREREQENARESARASNYCL
eukprot:6214405-Pleurochrysis_carterae.AAC.1